MVTGYGPARQDKAIRKEFLEAIEDGNHALAVKIAKANPDLFRAFSYWWESAGSNISSTAGDNAG